MTQIVEEWEVVVAPESFEYRRLPMTGIIYLRAQGCAFPDAQWDDFPVAVLRMWVDSVVALLSGAETEQFHFMDGPWWCELSMVDAARGAVEYSCRDGRKSLAGREVMAGRTTLDVVRRALVSASRRTLAEVERRGWVDDDTRALEAEVAAVDHPGD